jgi:BolA protein
LRRPTGSETHFKVVVISERFRDARTPISRHRLVNDALKEEVATDGPVHALSIVAMTPEKWQERVDKGEVVGPSPNCRGGDGALPKKNEASI